MDVRQLRFFLAVAEHGSVTSASEALYTAQPALSQAIRALEEELGTELFHRMPRGMELSAAGAALLGPAHQIARGIADVHDTVHAIAELRQGRLDVVAPADLALDPLVGLVARFRAAHPGVWVNLRDVGELGDTATVVHSAGCEVGVGYLPVKQAQVVTHVLGRRELSLALPPGRRRRRSVALREIAGVPLILPPRGTVVRDLVEAAWGDLGIEPRVVIETDHLGSVHRLVRAGVGAAFLPPAFAERAASSGVVVVGTTPTLGRDFGLLHRDAVLSPAARAFVALAAEPRGRDL
ncbi:LysR family transcriptional regulator [Saccharopolyspora sp. NPDC050642]|uniref:LysR family transcriptional regulator n=1 Tax=Saccharopolyspora sp. NPDC050642 TaxID=3157099 RepID=UPI0033F89643